MLKCTYDDTLDNPILRDGLEPQGLSEPVDVFPGEGAMDEVCLGLFGIVF